MLASRMSRIASSPTLKGLLAAERLRSQGMDVVDLGAGEPDFPTPDHVKAAAKAAIDGNFTKYTANAGTVDLRTAIAAKYAKDYGISFTPAEVIVTAGGKQALANAALAVFGPGDEVITHVPGWPTIVEQIKLADATPVAVETRPEDGFAIRADAILRAITPRTRGIIINSPCNPTGALISEEDLGAIADVAAKQDIWLVLDLCYEKLIYDPVPHNLPKVLAAKCPDQAVICGSASKAYAMTGWRCGWTIGPAKMIAASNALQSHATSNVNSITQKAVVEALNGSQAPVKVMLDEYRTRRDNLYNWLTASPHIKCLKPGGAFYMFPDIRSAMSAGGFKTSTEFAQALLEEQRVAVTPGEAFDAPGFLRISYATSMENLREGSRRLVEFVNARAAAGAAAPLASTTR